MKKSIYFLSTLFLTVSSSSLAFLPTDYEERGIKNTFCFSDAAKHTGIDEKTLKAIAMLESQNVNIKEVQKGNYGVLQINSIWSSELKKHNLEMEDMLDPCKAILFGASLLQKNKRETPEEWKYIGRFNSHNEKQQRAYYNRVMSIKNKIR